MKANYEEPKRELVMLSNWCHEVMHVEENNPAIIEIISMEGSNVVESLSCQIQALIKCLGLVKKPKKISGKGAHRPQVCYASL